MPVTRTQLLARLDEWGIEYKTTDHRPIFTVEEGQEIKASLPGGHTKNLFLKDKAGALFLICALGDTPIRINRLHPVLGCKRLSFGKPDLMEAQLGVTPGSVTFFALINDPEQQVRLVLDKALLHHNIVNFHPLENTATTAIHSQDMLRLAHLFGHEPTFIDFTALQAGENSPS